MIRLRWFGLFFVLLLLSSCAQKRETGAAVVNSDKSYKGQLNADVDPGLAHVMHHQKEIFEFDYDSVHLNIQYKNEADMLQDFRTGKATVLIMARTLDSAEKESLIDRDTMYVRELQVAYDAVALVGNRQFNDSALDGETLKKYFAPDDNSTNGPLMVFEDKQGSAVKFVLNKLGYKEKVSNRVYALKSAEEVIDYVKKD